MEDKEKIGRENTFHGSEEVSGERVEGYDFDKGVDWEEIIERFGGTGYQATHLSRAIGIVNKMLEDRVFVYLGFTSNMVTSGLRDVFRYLVKNKKVNVVVTTAGGIEEDVIKCLGDFILGDFKMDGAELRGKGVNRTGNILVPNSRYVKFEDFFQPILEELWEEQLKTGRVISSCDLIWKLGERINDDRSYLTWAFRNKIRVFCPAITDGAIGDNIYFFKFRRPRFKIDVAEDIKEMNDTTFDKKKTGLILLGSGVIKHHILNANMLRNGADYTVYINNAQEFDGSDAGATPDEATSWGKILPGAESVKVFGDATILFPILVGKSFARGKNGI